MYTTMKDYSKWLFVFSVLITSSIMLVVSGCKKDDKAAPIPVQIKNYYPNSGQGGTLVTVEGEGFLSNINQYKATIAGAEAEVISATSKSIVVRMPAGGKTGSLLVEIGNKAYEVGQYTYQSLTVSRVFPTNGPAGSQIRISGAGFSSIKSPAVVLVNNNEALIVSATDTLIVAEIPVDAGTGAVVVKVDGMEAKGQSFKYQAISGIKPLSGGANTRVTIRGSGFETTTTGNTIDFNGKEASVVSATEEEIVVMAPDGVSTGVVSVNINGQKITGPAFNVVGKPVISMVTPLSGPKGVEMTITGDIFSDIADENKVFINGVEVPVQAAAQKQLKLVVPGGTGSGIIKVVVNDQATDGPSFKDQTLGIAEITPDNGLAGTSITITGTGFSNTASENQVYFNGVPAVIKTATETMLVMDAPAAVSTGEVKVLVNGQEALAPKPFKRAGVITFVGSPANPAFSSSAVGIAMDSHGNLYVTDPQNKVVKKISPSGSISVLQANGADIVFDYPSGIVIDKNDNIFVSDQNIAQIRKITPAGQNLLFSSGFQAGHLMLDNAGNIYANVIGFGAGMNKVNITGNYSRVSGPNWPMYRGAAAGNLYYPDQNINGNNGVAITPVTGLTRNFVGNYSDGGLEDGVGGQAKFNGIMSVILSNPDELIVSERNNYSIRKIQISTATVTTVAKFTPGFADGTLSTAKMGYPVDLVLGKDGSIYVLDANNGAIRKIFLQ